mgnify:CR=1 FL=1
MPVKNGSFIKLEYTGKVQETGDVFDTTDEKVAEKKPEFQLKINLTVQYQSL